MLKPLMDTKSMGENMVMKQIASLISRYTPTKYPYFNFIGLKNDLGDC
jgi:hypothetical protein